MFTFFVLPMDPKIWPPIMVFIMVIFYNLSQSEVLYCLAEDADKLNKKRQKIIINIFNWTNFTTIQLTFSWLNLEQLVQQKTLNIAYLVTGVPLLTNSAWGPLNLTNSSISVLIATGGRTVY